MADVKKTAARAPRASRRTILAAEAIHGERSTRSPHGELVEPRTIPNIPAFRPDGSVINLAAPKASDIDFAAMAGALSKIARFNGIYRDTAYPVAQHCVMGADALFSETGDGVLAGYFLLHDGHEYLLGDWTRPCVAVVEYHFAQAHPGLPRAVKAAIETARETIDAVILEAAGLPPLARMPAYRRQVADMDDRMLRAEGLALFGPRAARHLPAAGRPAPKLTGAIRGWGAMKAEEGFAERLERYLGIVVR